MKRLPLAAAFWTMCGTAAAEGSPQAAIELFVDTNTRQIFAEPGPGRQRLGKFVQASDERAAASAGASAPAGALASGSAGAGGAASVTASDPFVAEVGIP